ncbi:MAG TPA: hypothetical protein VEX38_03710, partial [Fimbriimonadaceae bacterium]|nr:hypothetical protein [Fimbriimonadaceae bacterium]
SDFGPGSMEESSGEGSGERRRVPLDDMLKVLQGDETALDRLIRTMNEDLLKAELPAVPVVWEASQIDQAVAGDAVLRKKLLKDLNVHMDGTPADFFTETALVDGIVIRAPLPITVPIAGKRTTLTGHVMLPYRPAFTRDVEKHFRDSLNPSSETIKGFFLMERQKLVDQPGNKEDVAKALQTRIDPNVLKRYAEAPLRVLQNARVVLNEQYMAEAEWKETETFQGQKLYKIVLQLTEEGRQRIWQYSRRHAGEQLLFIADGVAIAAPRIRQEISQGEVTITQVPEPTLVRDTVDLINELKKKS